MYLSSILTLVPIIIVFILLVKKIVPTHWAGIIGWALMVLLAMTFFNTPLIISLSASLMGLIQSFPITLMTLFATLQIGLMEETGCLKRIAVFFKTLAPANKAAQLMTINIGTGTLLVSAGATPVTVLPPVLKGMGYSNFMSIALPALGFDALCTYSMLCAPMVIYSDLTGISLVEAAKVFSLYLPVVSTSIALAILYLVGGWKLVREGLIPGLIAGLVAGFTAVAIAHISALNGAVLLTGIIAGIMVVLAMMILLKIKGEPLLDRGILTEEEKQIEKSMGLIKAFSPWIFLVAVLLFVNFYKPLNDYLYFDLAMPVSVVPGKVVKMRMLWNAYSFTLLSTIVAMFWLKPSKNQIRATLKKWRLRSPGPVITLSVFFAMGFVMNYSGMVPEGPAWKIVDPLNNMTTVLALVSSKLFGSAYALITAPLGLFAGFVTSTEGSALAMFTQYTLITAKELGINPLLVASAIGIGGGLAGVISPGKLQSASAVLDCQGEERDVIKKVFPIALVLTLISAVLCFIYTKIF